MAQERYKALQQLVERYKGYRCKANEKDISEETIRMWINEFLGIFGWDVQDTGQVLQEKTVNKEQKQKLGQIHSEHTKPDYTLVNGNSIKTYLDAKKLSVNLFQDKEAAFQIRSYGWSANVPCAFLSNFEQLVIFDCCDTPYREQEACVGAIQLTMDQYLTEFEVIEKHFDKAAVYNNQLEKCYQSKGVEGKQTVDVYFNKILSQFRTCLANALYQNHPEIMSDTDLLSYYVQVIVDRIIFIRVCESRGIEKTGWLRECRENGFWSSFQSFCAGAFYEHYDGAMFEWDEVFNTLVLEDELFYEFLDKLYYPYPYKFDVIPVRVIAKVYEEFLSYGLAVQDGKVKVVLKEDYVKTNGAVPTKEFMVNAVCNKTMNLDQVETVEELLALRILDPCCGSGIFLVSIYEKLLQRLLELAKRGSVSEQERFLVEYQGRVYPSVEAKQLLMKQCLYGIDYDQVAVEVTKMSLALKIIDDTNPCILGEAGIWEKQILQNIHRNIVCGNTLISTDIELEGDEIPYIKPIDFVEGLYQSVFREKGGFDYVLGNPPYVETKYFKAASVTMHQYLKSHYTAFEGKADLAVLFVECCLNLLHDNGKLGFVIQRRWFKTTYGRGARKVIAQGRFLEKLYDIKATDLFQGRITYVSVLVLGKSGNIETEYESIPGDLNQVEQYFEENREGAKIPTTYFTQEIWSPEFYEMEAVKRKYAEKWGALGENPSLHIRDGIQALWKKMYHITEYQEAGDYLIGRNGFREEVKLEKAIVKPVIYNRIFTPLKRLIPDAYCLFPYQGEDYNIALSIEQIRQQYPLAYTYLFQNERRIKEFVKCREGDYWHTFTREHNHKWFSSPKVIIPMTARDTIATYEKEQGLYMDNSNVWFLNVDNKDDNLMKALTMIINSTVFSVFAKSGANPQSGGYYKFNKQFLTPVPLPNQKLNQQQKEVIELAVLYHEIQDRQREYERANRQQKLYFKGMLDAKWKKVDQVCNSFYEIEEADLVKIYEVGRIVDRVTGESGEKEW